MNKFCAILLCALLLPTLAQAQGQLDYDGRVRPARAGLPHALGDYETQTTAATGENFELVGRWIGGEARSVALRSTLAVAGTVGGLIMFDITDVAAPVELTQFPLPGSCYAISLVGSHAYVSDGAAGLRIIDLSDPTAPREVGSHSTGNTVADALVDGDLAYLADGWGGLAIVDISDPTRPSPVGALASDSFATGVVVRDGYAYLSTRRGLQVIDVSTPTAPVLLSEVQGYEANAVAVAGAHAFLASPRRGLVVIDIADPVNPHVKTILPSRLQTLDLTISGGYLHLDELGYYSVVDITNPDAPTRVSSTHIQGGLVWGLTVDDGLAILANGRLGLSVFDISNPLVPEQVGRCPTGQSAQKVVVRGDHAYLAGAGDGLRILDVSDSARPVTVNPPESTVGTGEVELGSEYAYLSRINSGGIRVLDVSDPAAPVEIAAMDPGWGRLGIELRGDYLYAAGSGLTIVDVSDPLHPVRVGNCDVPGLPVDVAVDGDIAYVAATLYYTSPPTPGGLYCIDISDPAAPTLLGSYALDHTGRLDAGGGYAYVTVEDESLVIFDVRDPSQPVRVATYTPPNTPYVLGVTLVGDRAYAACNTDGLRVLDVSDPAHPVEIGSYDTGWSAESVTVTGNLVYVCDFINGLYILRSLLDAPMTAHLDILPGSCLNPLNVNGPRNGNGNGGVLPVALLGSDELDVRDVDVTSLALEDVPPIRYNLEDVSGMPSSEDACACPEHGPDGHSDFLLKFGRSDVVAALGDVSGDQVPLTLTGRLKDGTEFAATDCVRIVPWRGDDGSDATRQATLSTASPNPFNPSTSLQFALAAPGHVRLQIFDIGGRLVNTLIDGHREAGPHHVVWEGYDDRGKRVASGVYLYRLETARYKETRRMVLVK